MLFNIAKILVLPDWNNREAKIFKEGDLIQIDYEDGNYKDIIIGKILSFGITEMTKEMFIDIDCSKEFNSNVKMIKTKNIKNIKKINKEN